MLRHYGSPFTLAGQALKHAVLLCAAAIILIPLFWMITTSLKPGFEVLVWPPRFLPSQPTFEAYVTVLTQGAFPRFFLNSVLISVCCTISVVLTSAIAGAIFAKHDFPLKTLIFGLILSTAIVPFETYMLPLFGMVVQADLINTYTAIVLPYLVMAFGIFLMRQNIASAIPDELLDAARIDGAGEMRVLFQIILPLSTSAMSALGIFAFIQSWTAFIWPLLVVNDERLFNMELGLASFQHSYNVDYNVLMAGSILSAAPLVLMFLFFRRRIIDGVALTGLKG